MSESLAILGSLLTLGLGLMGLVRPDQAAAFTSITPVGLVGRSEIRATYGGFFVALGACGLVMNQPVVWTVLGLAWLGAAAGRAVSAVVDGSREAKNFGGIAFEAAIGLALLAPLALGSAH